MDTYCYWVGGRSNEYLEKPHELSANAKPPEDLRYSANPIDMEWRRTSGQTLARTPNSFIEETNCLNNGNVRSKEKNTLDIQIYSSLRCVWCFGLYVWGVSCDIFSAIVYRCLGKVCWMNDRDNYVILYMSVCVCIKFMFSCEGKKIWRQHWIMSWHQPNEITMIVWLLLLMEEIPNNHLGCIKPRK